MLAEMAMFIQVLGMAVRASILPSIVVILVLIMIYLYRDQIKWFIRGTMRCVCWLIICLVDGNVKADCIKVKKVADD